MAHLFSVRPLALFACALAAGCATAAPSVPPQPPEAAPQLRAALAADPGNPDLAWRLATSLRAGQQPAAARDVLDDALERSPEHAPSLHLLGVLREDLGDPAGAIEAYDRFLAVAGDTGPAARVRDRVAVVRRRLVESQVRAALDDEAALTAAAPLPRTVAIFPFSYTGAESSLRPLGRALTHMLATDMAATERVTVLERLEVQLLADEITLSQTGLVDPATGIRGGRLLRAENVVQGQVAGDAQRIALTAGMLQSTSEVGDPARVEAEDALDRFFEAEGRLAVGLFEAMGIELTAAERERVGRRRTANLQALLAFGLGVEAQDAGRYGEAVGHYERAISLDPDFEDAQRGLEEATALEEEEDDEEFAWLGGDLLRPSPWELWLDRRGVYLPIERIIPDLGGRDPWTETTDGERIGPQSGTVILVIPRPGGDR